MIKQNSDPPPYGFIENLEPAVSRKVRSELRSRKKQEYSDDENFENKAWLVVHSLKPSIISIGRDPKILLPSGNYCPDTIAFIEKYVLLIESKYTESPAYISGWISKYRQAKKDRLSEKLKSNYDAVESIIQILVVKSTNTISKGLKSELKQIGIRLLDERDLNYFLSIHKAIGIGVQHLFWGKIAPGKFDDEKPIPGMCVRVEQKREALIFAANPQQILSRSFVSHREIHSPDEGIIGYQRMLQPAKLRKIANYIKAGKSFPTPIIVAFNRRGDFFEQTNKEMQPQRDDDNPKNVSFGFVKLPPEPGLLQIIDGQHRLYGYTKVDYDKKHTIQVVAYNKLDPQTPANMFVDINHEQTPVKSNLLWELYPDIYSKDDPNYYLAIISAAVEAEVLDNIPDKVQLISRGKKGPITFQTLCSEIKKTGLIGKNTGLLFASGTDYEEVGRKLRKILNALFGAMIALGHDNAAVNSELLFTNNGIVPILKITSRIVRLLYSEEPLILSRRQDLQERFQAYLKPIYNHYNTKNISEIARSRKAATGGAGHLTEDDKMTGLIRKEWPDFPFRRKYVDSEYKEIIDRLALKTDEVNSLAISTGKSADWIIKQFQIRQFKRSLQKPIDDESSLNYFLNVLYNVYYEGGGKGGEDNRIKLIMSLGSIKDIKVIKDIDNLRLLYDHYETQIDENKRRNGLAILRELSGVQNLNSKNELQPEEFMIIAKKLASRLISELIDPLLNLIAHPNNK